MNTCSTCKYWRKIRDEDLERGEKDSWRGPHGECKIINEYSQELSAWFHGTLTYLDEDIRTSYTMDTDREGNYLIQDMSLITMPNFGCLLWEE